MRFQCSVLKVQIVIFKNGPVAQLVRASPCHGEGRRFESDHRLYGIQFHMDGFPSGQRGQTVNLLQFASVVRIHLHPFSFSGIFLKRKTYHIQHNIAGWSSLEARRAHNPKVIGSNPVPATKI